MLGHLMIAFALAAPAGPVVPPGCEQRTLDTQRVLICDKLVGGSIRAPRPPLDSKSAVEVVLSGWRTAFGEVATRRRERLTVEGKALDAEYFELGPPETRRVAWIVERDEPNAVTLFTCLGLRDVGAQKATCERILPSLRSLPAMAFKAGPAPGSLSTEPAVFNGKKLAVPAGCRGQDGKGIECELATLTVDHDSGVTVPLANRIDAFSEGIQATLHGRISQRKVSCLVQGRGATCWVFRSDNADGSISFVVAAEVQSGEDREEVTCIMTDVDLRERFPRPCDQLFEWPTVPGQGGR